MRLIGLLTAILALSACKIVISVPDGGRIDSESGAHNCASGKICEIDVLDVFFEETFVATPREGQQFLGWKKQDKGLCGGKTTACELASAPLKGNDFLETLLESEELFYLDPVFAPEGGPSFNVRYCEVLIGRNTSEGFVAEVWGSQGLNDCPESNVRALDPSEIAKESGAVWASINGPRHWVLDDIKLNSVPPGFRGLENIRQEFGGIEMRLLTSVSIPSGAPPSEGEGYQAVEVARDTLYTFVAGRRVYELVNPDGRRYLMQSFSQAVRRGQHITELADLGSRLQLPEGWRFLSYVLEDEFRLPSGNGVAEVVTDNLANTYQLIPD